MQQTLSIIKPDATQRQLVGEILARLEQNGFRIVAIKMVQLNQEQAEGFYIEHREKPFFAGLIEFMCSAPIVVAVLEKQNAVQDYRTLIGATDPKNAAEGTLRKEFAIDGRQNSLHGSDSIENAAREIAYFFADSEIF